MGGKRFGGHSGNGPKTNTYHIQNSNPKTYLQQFIWCIVSIDVQAFVTMQGKTTIINDGKSVLNLLTINRLIQNLSLSF